MSQSINWIQRNAANDIVSKSWLVEWERPDGSWVQPCTIIFPHPIPAKDVYLYMGVRKWSCTLPGEEYRYEGTAPDVDAPTVPTMQRKGGSRPYSAVRGNGGDNLSLMYREKKNMEGRFHFWRSFARYIRRNLDKFVKSRL